MSNTDINNNTPKRSTKKLRKLKILTYLAVALILMALTAIVTWKISNKPAATKAIKDAITAVNSPDVNSYDTCIKNKSSKTLETYPLQCVTTDGRSYTDPTATKPISKSDESGTAGSSGIGSQAGAGGSVDQSVRTLMPDVACRTKAMAAKEDPSTDQATVIYQDLNADSVEEAIISIALSGTGKYGEACVYTVKNKSLELLWSIPASDVLAHGNVAANTGTSFKYTGVGATNGGPNASATPDTTYIYKWNGSGFVKQ